MKNNKMPGMPNLNESPVLIESSEVSEGVDTSEVILEAPEHKPELNSHEDNLSSSVKILTPKKGIEVVATRPGFYNLHRLKEGDKFVIKSFEELGEWMKCIDPDLQKKHLEHIKNKKARK